jgi:hypothetical protein
MPFDCPAPHIYRRDVALLRLSWEQQRLRMAKQEVASDVYKGLYFLGDSPGPRTRKLTPNEERPTTKDPPSLRHFSQRNQFASDRDSAGDFHANHRFERFQFTRVRNGEPQ